VMIGTVLVVMVKIIIQYIRVMTMVIMLMVTIVYLEC
jgi:hypothetical protein